MTDEGQSFLLTWGFILLPLFLVLGVGFLLQSWRLVLVLALWAGIASILSLAGVTAEFSWFPPPSLMLLAMGLALVIVMALTRVGSTLSALSLGFLVSFQAFRVPVELLIQLAVSAEVAPPQMSWGGMNFDIVAGASALLLAPMAARLPKIVLLAWNTLALGLLLWAVSVAVRSLPTPLQQFEATGLWVTEFPYILLPSILVPLALLGHLVLYRKLWAMRWKA